MAGELWPVAREQWPVGSGIEEAETTVILTRQPSSAQILTADSVQQQPIAAPGGSEINHGIHRNTRKRESDRSYAVVDECTENRPIAPEHGQDGTCAARPISSISRTKTVQLRKSQKLYNCVNPIRINFPFPCPSVLLTSKIFEACADFPNA